MNSLRKNIEKASENIRLQEGFPVIEQLILECYLKPGISTKNLARKALLPVPVATAIKKELIKADVLKQDRGVRCTDEANTFIENEWKYRGLNKALYQTCMENTVNLEREFSDTLLQLEALFQSRPQVNVQIDQSACTPETSLKRALLCLQEHSLIGKRILCVGDDDLVSVSLGFLLKRLFPNETGEKAFIDVVDIDERFLSFIREIAEKESLPIKCHQVDLRQPLPEKMLGQYDCFFTDPPYTLQGMSLFVSRGISALKRMKGLPMFLSFAHKSPDVTLAMQREFVRMGLVINEMLPRFNEYNGAQMIGNRSQMIILKTTDQTIPEFTAPFEDALYTGEVKRTIRTYRCKQCGESTLVGFQRDIATIEELKNQGCPNCKNDTFDLIAKKEVD